MLLRISILFLFLLQFSCTSLIASGGNRTNTYTQEDSRSLEQISWDAKITEQVNQIINHSGYRDVYADTIEGVVKLKGSISGKSAETRLLEAIQRLNGVKSVESTLVYNKAN